MAGRSYSGFCRWQWLLNYSSTISFFPFSSHSLEGLWIATIKINRNRGRLSSNFKTNCKLKLGNFSSSANFTPNLQAPGLHDPSHSSLSLSRSLNINKLIHQKDFRLLESNQNQSQTEDQSNARRIAKYFEKIYNFCKSNSTNLQAARQHDRSHSSLSHSLLTSLTDHWVGATDENWVAETTGNTYRPINRGGEAILGEKRDAKELATPQTMATFTCPRLGICRPLLVLDLLDELLAPIIISDLLPSAISVLFALRSRILQWLWSKCTNYDESWEWCLVLTATYLHIEMKSTNCPCFCQELRNWPLDHFHLRAFHVHTSFPSFWLK